LRLSVKGGVVGRFGLDEWHHCDGAVGSAVVVALDPAGGGLLDVGDGLEGSVVGQSGARALGLEQTINAFRQSITVCVADTADGWADALKCKAFGEENSRVLSRFNRWLQHWLIGVRVVVR